MLALCAPGAQLEDESLVRAVARPAMDADGKAAVTACSTFAYAFGELTDTSMSDSMSDGMNDSSVVLSRYVCPFRVVRLQ